MAFLKMILPNLSIRKNSKSYCFFLKKILLSDASADFLLGRLVDLAPFLLEI